MCRVLREVVQAMELNCNLLVGALSVRARAKWVCLSKREIQINNVKD